MDVSDNVRKSVLMVGASLSSMTFIVGNIGITLISLLVIIVLTVSDQVTVLDNIVETSTALKVSPIRMILNHTE